MQRKKDFYDQLKGKRQGDLTIIDWVETKPRVGKIWKCRCSCGRTVYLPTSKIAYGKATCCPECGIERSKQASREQLTKHGLGDTHLHTIWWAMISRCYFEGDTNYPYYGRKGIKVCDGWKNDFQLFYEWAMKNGYSDRLTLDRIDVAGDYCPENCRWVSMTVQNINKQSSHLVTVRGITMCITHWGKAIGKSHATICKAKNPETYIDKHFPDEFVGYNTTVQGKEVFVWTGGKRR